MAVASICRIGWFGLNRFFPRVDPVSQIVVECGLLSPPALQAGTASGRSVAKPTLPPRLYRAWSLLVCGLASSQHLPDFYATRQPVGGVRGTSGVLKLNYRKFSVPCATCVCVGTRCRLRQTIVQPLRVRTARTYLPAALPFAFNETSEAFRSAIRSTAGAGADFGVTASRVLSLAFA